MRRQKIIEISGINIVTQPHSSDGYIGIIRSVNQRAVPIRGNEYLMISGLRPHMNDDWLTGIEGELVKFSNIDEHARWVDITSGKLAEDGEVPELPSHLRPNGALFPFIFHLTGRDISHRLFYISKSRNSHSKKIETLSPNFVERLFTTLFSERDISFKFKSINITVIPESSALDSIFNLPKLNKLFLRITPPNPDDLEDVEKSIYSRLKKMEVVKEEQTYYGEKGESIKPDLELKQLTQVASQNGYVSGVGKNSDDVTVHLSTKNKPLREPIAVDNDGLSEREALRSFRP